jgi:RNA polymerase sigma-70 factor (ECF subfamily)
VKGLLARAVARTAGYGPSRSSVRRWIRWLPDGAALPDPRFQGPDEPYPRHWRRFPTVWPAGLDGDPAVRERLRRAVRSLPDSWRAVLLARDAEQVATDLGLTPAQQRRIRGRARAAVRDAVADLIDGDAPR